MTTIDKIMVILCILLALAGGYMLAQEMVAHGDQVRRIELKLNGK